MPEPPGHGLPATVRCAAAARVRVRHIGRGARDGACGHGMDHHDALVRSEGQYQHERPEVPAARARARSHFARGRLQGRTLDALGARRRHCTHDSQGRVDSVDEAPGAVGRSFGRLKLAVMRSRLKFGRAALLALSLAVAGPAIRAQDYPNRPITLVVAYPPGGGIDAVTRLVGQKLSQALSTSVVVENRAGFSGNIGAASVARAAPDGYTLLLAPWTTYAINSLLYPGKVGYVLDKDFA